IKTINNDVRLQALINGKKVVITEVSIRHDLKWNDAEGTLCLPNAVIFEELARMGAKTTSWNEFSSTMACAIICLANNQKFNFSKYILDNLKKNLEAGLPFYMFPRVESLAIKETIVDKEESSKQERKIADIDVVAKVNQENVYNLDMAHEETVLSMQDVTDADGKEVTEEMVEIITTAKTIVDEVSTAGGELNAANEKPTVEDNVWKLQKGPKGLARVKNWKLFDSCGVHCVTLDTIQLYLLAEKMYPLTNYTLQQMFNEVRLQVDYEVEMAYDLLRLVIK
nr:hypothetical protein [Tanacetum cinerariifolium]